MLTKANDSTDYKKKIEELVKEIKKEKESYRKNDMKKLREIHKNYGNEDRDF
jgi:hypothetical protein